VQEEEEEKEGRPRGRLQEQEEEEAAMRPRARRMILAGSAGLAALVVALTAAPVAGATTFRNGTPIAINEQGDASPYRSSITVSGTANPITDVNLGIDDYSHGNPDDVGILLVAPGGQALKLMDCVGGAVNANSVDFTFDGEAATQPPDNGTLTTGTVRPTSYCTPGNSTVFFAPGPLSSYNSPAPQGVANFASVFNGHSPIGTWNLFVRDRALGGAGSISGWSLDVKPDVTPLPAVTTPTTTPIATPLTPAVPAKKCKKKKAKKRAAAAGCKKKKKQ
jgi:subtilisin-like proprotein convertase family protein